MPIPNLPPNIEPPGPVRQAEQAVKERFKAEAKRRERERERALIAESRRRAAEKTKRR